MKKEKILILFAFLLQMINAEGQMKKISGEVSTADDPSKLTGVSIIVKGTDRGTSTNAQGKFLINANIGEVLVFSFLGFQEKEMVIDRDFITVVLNRLEKSMNDVIVIGYGSQKKSDVTGAISSVSSKALKEVPVTNVSQMLQGRAAGVYVLNTGNKPGAGVSVQIRGRRSFNAGNDPLYVIDGIPISGGLNDINPGDIASIEVLKDASATAR